MARTKDLWHTSVKDPSDPTKTVKKKTRKHPDNGGNKNACRWLAIWHGKDGKEKTRAFATKEQARAHGVAMEADRLRGVYVDHQRGRMYLKDFANDKWKPAQVHLRSNSTDTYASHLKTHILPALGGRRLGELDRSDMKNFVALLVEKGLAPSTVETVFAVVRSIMQSAVDDGFIGANPCSRVPLPRVEPRVVEPLPVGAILALAESITPRYRLTVWLGAGLGLREGEALGLTKLRVEFLKRRALIRQQAQGGKLVELKTKASKRTLPVDDLIIDEINRHMARKGYKDGPEGVLITNRIGKIVQRSSFGTCWREAVEKAGLPEGTRFHDLRHFYASALIRANLNPKVIQTRLGHATMAETWDTYGHLFPDDEDLGRGAIGTLFADAPAELRRNQQ